MSFFDDNGASTPAGPDDRLAEDEVLWATSTTGDDFRCVHVDDWRIAKARIAELEAALREIATTHEEVQQTPTKMAAALYYVSDLAKRTLQKSN